MQVQLFFIGAQKHDFASSLHSSNWKWPRFLAESILLRHFLRHYLRYFLDAGFRYNRLCILWMIGCCIHVQSSLHIFGYGSCLIRIIISSASAMLSDTNKKESYHDCTHHLKMTDDCVTSI